MNRRGGNWLSDQFSCPNSTNCCQIAMFPNLRNWLVWPVFSKLIQMNYDYCFYKPNMPFHASKTHFFSMLLSAKSMCLSVCPTGFGTRKCLQKQQGGKWGLKNRMPAWHRQVSVSAALPTTGSAVSDKYKHSHPDPAFLSQRQQQYYSTHWLAAGRFSFLAPDAEEKLFFWDTRMGW